MLVGDGDESFVVADAVAELDDPVLQVRALLGHTQQCTLQGGASALGKQAPQVSIASLGDDAEVLLAAGTGLLGDQADPSSHLPTVTEVAGVADRADEGAGGDRSDAINGAQALCTLVVLGMQGDLRFAASDLPIEQLQMLARLLKQGTYGRGDGIIVG
jgi:hypothetical protein